MKRKPSTKLATLQDALRNARGDYSAGKLDRYRRARSGLQLQGSGADYHFRSETEYLRAIEYARDMDRNDTVVGPMVDRVVSEVVQSGFSIDPQTSDSELDNLLWQMWSDWANNPTACDAQGHMTYADMERLVYRATLVDGDIFALPRLDGTLQLVEAHRCRNPYGKLSDHVLGVTLDGNRKRVSYMFTEDDIDPWLSLNAQNKVTEYAARSLAGKELVFHIYNPKRVTQTRGVTAFAPVFDALGMFEDIQFAKLVQQQIVSAIAFIRNKALDFSNTAAAGQYGAQQTDSSEGFDRLIDNISPGMEIEGRPGETITGFSPNTPNAEYFEHAKLTLQLIGAAINLPLLVYLLDGEATNFSGFRGAIDQARIGWRVDQQWLSRRFHQKVYRWKVEQWAQREPRLRDALANGLNIYSHRWTPPAWDYIEPEKDARADALRIEKMLISPRRLHNRRQQDYDEIITETVADNAYAIRAALTTAAALSAEFGVRIDPTQLLHLDPSKPIAIAEPPPVASTLPDQPQEVVTDEA